MQLTATDVAWSACLCVFVWMCDGHIDELCENRWSDRDAVWVADLGRPKEPCTGWGVQILRGNGQFCGLSAPLRSIWRLCCGVHKNVWTNRDAVWAGLTQRWGHGRKNTFAAATVARGRCGLLSEFFDHLLFVFVLTVYSGCELQRSESAGDRQGTEARWRNVHVRCREPGRDTACRRSRQGQRSDHTHRHSSLVIWPF